MFFLSLLYFHFVRFVLFVSCSSSVMAGGGVWSIDNVNGDLMYRNEPFLLKGLNWFGYETPCRIVHGLWARPLDDFLKTVSDYEYNAIRLPFSIELIETWEMPPLTDCLSPSNQWLGELSVRNSLHVFFSHCRELGLTILLDFHSIHHDITEFPWTDDHSIEDVLRIWTTVINEFSAYPNLLGVDIKNEPHGKITWPVWSDYVQQFVDNLHLHCPKFEGFIFIEGLQDHSSVWGGSFQSMSQDWILYQESNRQNIVFSPHVYGVSIRGESAMSDTDQRYDDWFGYLHTQGHALVIGEVGGWYIEDDEVWEKRFLQYLLQRNMTNVFYWCLNPDSTDTGGIFYNDWKTPNMKKINFHDTLQPYPTAFIFQS